MMPNLQQVEEIIRDTILAEIISACQAANMPKSFIENITFTKVSDTQYVIENSWKNEDGVPLAVFFEYGTRDHWIEPKDGGVLAWESKGPESGQKKAIYSKRHDNVEGDTKFSKGHYVTGLPALEPMHNGFRIGYKRMRDRLENG